MEKVKVSKTVLIIEEIFYIFMIIYGAMFLIAFTLSAFKMNMWFGILIGALCGLGAGIFVYFVLFRLKLICTKKVIYESDLVFWRRFIPSKHNEEEKEEVKSIVSDKVKENNLYLSEADIEKRIIMYDSTFNKESFNELFSLIYKLYEDSLNKQDSLLVRPFIDDDFYFRHNLVINGLSNRNDREKRNYVKIKDILFRDFKIVDDKQVLVLDVTSKMKKYSVDKEGEVVTGSKDDFIDCHYVFTLIRRVGIESSNEVNTNICPNCREVIKVNDDGVCEHCHVDIATGDFGWVITDVKEI